MESSSVSSAEATKLELQLRQTKNVLEDTRAELDRLKQASSGSEKDKAALQQQLNTELSQLKFVVCIFRFQMAVLNLESISSRLSIAFLLLVIF